MNNRDIGIDLGTKTTMVGLVGSDEFLCEASVATINIQSENIVAIGDEAYKMVGKTPPRIKTIYPLKDGVISNYYIAKQLVKLLVSKIKTSSLVKPRIAICVPSSVTGIESDALVEAGISVNARQVFLIEEPFAAAIGCGMDISKPCGNMIVDIGGGTTDTAVISLYGKVISYSVKMGGNVVDDIIIKTVKNKFDLLIGEIKAENIKINIGSLSNDYNKSMEVKGLSLKTRLPDKIIVSTKDLRNPIMKWAKEISDVAQKTLEGTPPELVGDIYEKGIVLTGGGALLHGLEEYLTKSLKTKVKVADDPKNCVIKGTLKSLSMTNVLESGFRNATKK